MADLLVRNLDAKAKSILAIRAAEHGCTQQAEAKAILEENLLGKKRSWVSMLRKAALENVTDSSDFELPARHSARPVETKDWA